MVCWEEVQFMNNNEERIAEIIHESFLGEYLKDEGITDIRFNGTTLWLQHNSRPRAMAEKQPSIEEVRRLIKQVSDLQGKDITNSDPILDTEIGFLRVNAVHEAVSPDGRTFAIRVSRPSLAIRHVEDMLPTFNSETLNEEVVENELMDQFSDPVGLLLKVLMQGGSNVLISGVTGTGKTELQKLLVGFIPDNKSVNLIEDTRDSHMKALYPQKDIMSWQTLMSDDRDNKITMQDLVRASMRNNPDYVIVAETRGEESADMLDVAKTGHSVITTVHAKEAILMPSRFIPMIKQSASYQTIDEVIIGREITELFKFGIQLEMETIGGKVVRRIKEIVEYTGYSLEGARGNVLYRQSFVDRDGVYRSKEELGSLSEETLSTLKDKRLFHLLPDVFKSGKIIKGGEVT